MTNRTPGADAGVLRDIDVVVRMVPTPQFTYMRREPRKRGRQDLHGYITPGERQDKRYLVTVEIDDMTYTVESSGNAFWDFDPSRLVINDSIGARCERTLRARM